MINMILAEISSDIRSANRPFSLPPMMPGENEVFRDQLLYVSDEWIRKRVEAERAKFSRLEQLRLSLGHLAIFHKLRPLAGYAYVHLMLTANHLRMTSAH